MTAPRRFGSDDTPFSTWIRNEPTLDSCRFGLAVNDCDLVVHKYKPIVDGLGTRQIAFHMWVEIKTRSAMPSDTQRETLFDYHQRLKSRGPLRSALTGRSRSVWHFGVFVLSMDGTSPDDSDIMNWCKFDDFGRLYVVECVDKDELRQILRFDVEPDNLQGILKAARRHHQTKELCVEEVTPLGFTVDRVIRKSS